MFTISFKSHNRTYAQIRAAERRAIRASKVAPAPTLFHSGSECANTGNYVNPLNSIDHIAR